VIASSSHSQRGIESESKYLNLRPGINLGAWRLHHYSTWSRFRTGQAATQTKWDSIYTYLQRDIKTLKSQLVFGDRTTPPDVFSSIPFRGVLLASDDEMIPDSLRGYAPVVRGIARTDAQVVIRQNGYTIYETFVAPGSFEITDVYPTGGSGDLYVTIRESDGSEQLIIVPYASLPVLQREGQMKYAVTSGQYRAYDSSIEQTPFMQANMAYGLTSGFTLYGGFQASSHYQSSAFGIGSNLGILGAVSMDVTHARSQQKNQQWETGQSWRIRYSKNFVEIGTNYTIAGYRYATDGYWDMQEVLETYRDGDYLYLQPDRRRNRAELSMSQRLWEGGGSLGLNAMREDYWFSNRQLQSYSASYNNSYNNIYYSLGYTYNKNIFGNSGRSDSNNQRFSLTVGIPLGELFGGRTTYANYAASSSRQDNTTHSVGLSGSALEDHSLNWSVRQGYGTKGQRNSGGINAHWRAAYGEVNGGYSYDQFNQRLNYGLQGSVIAHSEGITLGQSLGETVALVAVPGAKDVSIAGRSGVKTDVFGYAIVPYTSPYRKNTLSLNSHTFDDDTEVELTTQTVIPSRGAVVKVNYKTNVGYRVLMTITQSSGQPVPFGATVSPTDGNAQNFIVGDAGQVYLTGVNQKGTLQAKWGAGADQQCVVNYSVPQKKNSIMEMTELCI
jgi:outer membrane usher protein